ncbi:hypothetical protein EDB86DRAFT_3087176 [Lactarius hatsudake]|nr:hypothetical protein EDB86DRAFT_3087176 [Lactarius hatsudake]
MSPQRPAIVIVSSVALVASVGVVETGQLGTVRIPRGSTEEHHEDLQRKEDAQRSAQERKTVEVINKPPLAATAIMKSFASDRTQPTSKHTSRDLITVLTLPSPRTSQRPLFSSPSYNILLSLSSSHSSRLCRTPSVVYTLVDRSTFRAQSLRRRSQAFRPTICYPFIHRVDLVASYWICPPSDQYRIPVSTPIPMTDFPSFVPLVSGKVHIVNATRVATLATHYSFFPIFDIGIPQTTEQGYPETIAYTEPLFNTMPALAKHFYRVLHNLFIYPYTPDFVMRYLRTRESFSAASWPHSLSSFPTSRSSIPMIQESPLAW